MLIQAPKFFNTTGPCVPEKHYMLPVLPRLPGVDEMIANQNYFIIYAPRQSGKTTFIKTLVEKINSSDQKYSFYCSLSTLREVIDENIAIDKVISQLNMGMAASNVPVIKQKFLSYKSLSGMDTPEMKVRILLNQLCLDLDKPLVLFFDEADLLSGPGLLSFLAQIRDGFNDRDDLGNKFPSSLALVGMRNIRDYLSSNHPESTGEHLASPFNIVAERMTLANFTQDEIGQLYSQHTEATGQIFQDEAIERAWYWTEGQPWLVNALARQTVEVILKKDYSLTVTAEIIDQAAQTLILRNDTHFDFLKERLNEPRIRVVMEAVLSGAANFPKVILDDDLTYALDLGLLKIGKINDKKTYLPANPIYQELIPSALNKKIQRKIEKTIPDSYGNKWMDGISLDMTSLLKFFQVYWSENAEIFIKNNMLDSIVANSIAYALQKYAFPKQFAMASEIIQTITDNLISLTNEALTHLVLFAFLQRVLHGGADFIQREYALGTLRADICVSYKGRQYPLELKIKGNKSHTESLEQLFGYMNKCLTSVGWLVVCDKDFAKPWDEKITWDTQEYKGKTIHVVGC